MTEPEIWRSILFVSPLSERHIEKAPGSGADAIQLDLEDAVAPDLKTKARSAMGDAVAKLRSEGVENVLVRVNRPWALAVEDLKCAVDAAVDVVTLPKVESVGHVATVDEMLLELEKAAGREEGATKLLLQVETALGMSRLDEIITVSKRCCAVTLGPEDFALDVQGQPTMRANGWANLEVLYAARRNNVVPLGFPGTIAEFRDLKAFREQIEFAKELGFGGALAIHPKQVEILNDVLSPSDKEVEYARKVVSAAEGVKGGVVAVDGKMIDLPIVLRAHQLIARAKA